MASYETDENNEGYDHSHNLSRLSVCTSSTMCRDVDDAMATYMSGLSIEEDDGDADAEVSDDKELLLSSDPDENELSSRYPSPARPPLGVKDYSNGNEAQKTKDKGPWRRKCRGMRKGTRVWEKNRSNSEKKEKEQVMKHKGFCSGESDESGLRVITRGKGRKSLCMELEEVKACRDLGFDLELQIPSLSLSFSNSTLDDTSTDATSITNWRISSPGDDPREVKARLKVWAQAVAASASKYST
uniref:Fold protein n=2 Tax=Phaseolus vulgaris TaxID=3885 RepID=V7BJ81_PHAVU|nr:hypothetical protein PHAVU_007G208300g [Phaseolus vulgaris]ESW17078.1 hypothetical protein PHAVU_007G208300g [Phaseolus vulgaris]